MKILILGGTGMLGHQLHRTLAERHETHVTVRALEEPLRSRSGLDPKRLHAGVDALVPGSIERVLREVRPQVVINCIGVVKQIAEAKDPVRCIEINALLPHKIAQQCETVDSRFVQISTDCVFDGRRGRYTEDDVSNAEDLYGRTKFLGEVARPNALTIRTSIVGTALDGDHALFDWFLRHGPGPVRGFTRAIFSGLTTRALSEELARLLERGLPTGLFHVSSDPISKYDLLVRLAALAGVSTEIVADDTFACDRSLDSTRYRTATGFAPPSWTVMLEQFVADRRTFYPWRRA